MSFSPLLPWWLIVLIALPVLALLGRALLRAWPIGGAHRWTSAARLGMVLAITMAFLHPGIGRAEATQGGTTLDVVIVLDRTTSMSAQDGPNGQQRLDEVREDVAAAATDLAGSRFALITFGRRSQLEMPFTTDAGALQAAMDAVRREEPLEGGGSSMDRPLEQVRALLERTQQTRPERARILLFLSDGETTEASGPEESYAPLKPLLNGGLVVGYGTNAGGKMQLFDDRDSGGFIFDEQTGQEALSKIDEPALRDIASQSGISYVHRTAAGQLSTALRAIDRDYTTSNGTTPVRHDLTWLWGLLLLACAAVELRGRITAMAQVLGQQRALTAARPHPAPRVVIGAQSDHEDGR